MIELVQIPKENTNIVWKQCEGMIADAMASSNNYANASHFKQWISEGKMQLWFLWDKEADIEAKMAEMANEPEQSKYAEQRRNAYPAIGDQLDMLWHSIDQDAELKQKYFDFYQAIKSVKVKYPKNG